MSVLREAYQKEADQLLPKSKVVVAFHGDDPLDTLMRTSQKVINLTTSEVAQQRIMFKMVPELRAQSLIYGNAEHYNDGPVLHFIRNYNFKEIPVHAVFTYLDGTAAPLKKGYILSPEFPDYVYDARLASAFSFYHNLSYPAFYHVTGITDMRDVKKEPMQVKLALKNKFGMTVAANDAELFQRRVGDLFAVSLAARKAKLPVADVGRVAANYRQMAQVYFLSALPRDEVRTDIYTSATIRAATPDLAELPKQMKPYALMESCIKIGLKHYDPNETPLTMLQEAGKRGLFEVTMLRRAPVIQSIQRDAATDPSLKSIFAYANDIAKASNEMLQVWERRARSNVERESVKQIRQIVSPSP